MTERGTRRAGLLMVLLSLAATMALAQQTPEQEAAHLEGEARRLLDAGRYQDGIETAERALALRGKASGSEHPDVAATLLILGNLQEKAGNYELAADSYQRSLAIREKILGADHPDTAKSVMNLANAHVRIGNYPKAESLYQRALATFETVAPTAALEISSVLSGLALLYTQTAAYERAEPLYERALAIREQTSGPTSIDAARVLHRLGDMYRLMGSYARAGKLFRRELAILEKALGPDHPETIGAFAGVAVIHFYDGAYVEAEAMYKRVVAILRRTVGAEHPNTILMLNNLAVLYVDTGAYNQAEPLLRDLISMQRKARNAGLAGLSFSLNNLGLMYSDMGLQAQAEPLCTEAVTIGEKVFGTTHPHTASFLRILARVYFRTGDYAKAEPLLKRALASYEAVAGQEHTGTADSIYELADLYADSGAYSRAEPLYRRAIEIFEKNFTSEHPLTVRALRSLAVLYWARGEPQQALSLLQRIQRIETRQAERFLAAGSEARKQDYQRTLIGNTFVDVSFAMATSGSAATQLGLTSVLQHKGRVLDAISDSVARLRRSIAPADQALLEQLTEVASQLSALTYAQAGNLSPEQYRTKLAQLSARQEQLESDLASRNQVFSREVTPVSLAGVQRAIPVDAVLVEWFRYMPFEPKRSFKSGRGSPRYVAYVLKRTGAPVAIDIGEAQVIEALARRLRVALANPANSDVKQHSAALSAKVLAPLLVHLRDAKHILFSPDGELNLIPLAALLDASGSYLAQHFDVSYLTSGRDLLRIADGSNTLGNAVVMADPDYGKRSSTLAANGLGLLQRSADLDRSGLMFRSLAGTAAEAQGLKSLFELDNVDVLLRKAASESKLKSLKSPGILHIASHGFFLSDQQFTAEMGRQRGSISAPLPTRENPLLRSGIALAGANERSSGEDDGILTALEATQLDLSGTELVVLSACDSGIGEVQNGEGVYGLRRALALAGAQTQVTSLWRVSDNATRRLMVDYYRRLRSGEGRAAALRSTQRDMLASSNFSHPYFWASFIAIGNWHPLPVSK